MRACVPYLRALIEPFESREQGPSDGPLEALEKELGDHVALFRLQHIGLCREARDGQEQCRGRGVVVSR